MSWWDGSATQPDPAVCACGFRARSNCLYLKLTAICASPSSPPAADRKVYTFTRGSRGR